MSMSTHRIAILNALEAHGGRYSYGPLRKELGIHKASFCDVIKKLHKAGLIHSEGTRRKRLLILGPPKTPPPELQASAPFAPKEQPPKERKCLRCGERFMSAWEGERTCRSCKASREYAADIPIQSLPYGFGRGL